MNLCFVNPSIAQRPEIYELAKHLPKKYHITILQPSNKIQLIKEFDFQENIHVKNVTAFFIPIGNSAMTLPHFNVWTKELLTQFDGASCDLIHFCDYEYMTSLCPLMIRKSLRVPMVIVNDSLLGVGGYSLGSPTLDLLSRVYTLSLGKKILQAYDCVVFLYSKLTERARELGVSSHKIRTIPNGIDVDEIESIGESLDPASIRSKYGIEQDERIILFVGRLVNVKRINVLIEVVKNLVQQGCNVRALIVGDGPLRTQLESMASSIKDRVVFTGSLFGKEKYECYFGADLFMLPSYSEGLPTVLLESSAAGLPAVATNVNGIPDIVVHNETGFLVDRCDFESFVKYARTLIGNEDLAKRMGRKAREHVKVNFSWEVIARQYEEAYLSLLH